MSDLTEWRGFDLRERRAKIERAFALAPVTRPEDVPLIVNTPCYFGFAASGVPEDYFTNPASMVAYQERGFESHLAAVNDDCMPYFMPWFGTGVLASAFGCEIKLQPGPGNDPAVAGPCIHFIHDVSRLHVPEPGREGWMPRVLDAIDYACQYSDLPVGLTDMQGPLDTLGLMCGQAQLYQWMYREPQAVHDLFDLVTSAFIDWVKLQKQHIGEPLHCSNGLQGVWSPGIGVWESDDDLVLLDPGLYAEFVVPAVSRIFETFGGGSVHFCGNGTHQIDNLRRISGLKVVNNSPMGHFQAFAALKERLGDSVLLEIQDAVPLNPESYYGQLFNEIDDFRGIMVAPFVPDTIGMDDHGGYEPTDRRPFDAANQVVKVVRECVRRKLAGERLVAQEARAAVPVTKPALAPAARPALSAEQETALAAVQDCLIEFDTPGIQAAVRQALQAGMEPFEIVTLGMAEGMAEVGRLYEDGEFFLPELVMAGATMNDGMAVLAPALKAAGSGKPKGTIVLGTVQGDMHDIGKNIVKTLLEAGGFAVHDIGVDQPVAAFVDKVQSTQADILAMSALLTTTMGNMERVMRALREAGLAQKVKVMVGGAPISREFADQIGAEGFAPDAVKAVREAERLMELRPLPQPQDGR